MRSKLLTLAATSVAGLALGAGVAAAQAGGDDGRPPVTVPAVDLDSMDEMHAAMRDRMPADLVARCDEMHAAMPEDMRSMDPGAMDPGAMGSMMGGAGRGPHQQHHR